MRKLFPLVREPQHHASENGVGGNLPLDPLAWPNGGLESEYDEENSLTKVKRASDHADFQEIAYDAMGRRVETVEYWDAQTGPLDPPRHTRHVYDGLQTVEEYECGTGVPACGSGWSLAREFVWGGRFPEPIAMVDHTAAGLLPANQPEDLHYLHDVLGSVIGLTNSAGTLVERYSYDPYGKTLVERRDPLTGSFELNGADGNFPTWSAFGNPFMWTGQRYDATVGRFVQRDPIGIEGGMNVYLYAANIPNLLVDPTGEAWLAPALHALRVGGRYVAQGARSAWGAAAPYANRAWQWSSNKATEFARACKSATKNTLRWLNRGKVRIGPSTHQGKTYLSIRLGDRHLDLIEIGDGWRKWYE